MSSQLERSATFYEALFGWRAGEGAADFGGYFMFERDGVPVAGALANPAPASIPDRWGVHVAVRDAAATLQRALDHGATAQLLPESIGELGITAVLTDPSGAPLGLWEPHAFEGLRVVNEANAPRWFELRTLDYDVVRPFYRDVLGWDLREVSNDSTHRYTTVHEDGSAFAGILDARGHQRRSDASAWTIYFEVESVDRALETVLAHAGSVLRPAHDTPYGRRAVVRDPGGVVFRVTQ